ncbi:hypothetical protein NIB75_17045 [Bacteroides uniformis]|nr:hypothetical protein [Bacteroides uniformis]
MKLKIILSVLLLFSLLKVDANPLVDISIASGKEEVFLHSNDIPFEILTTGKEDGSRSVIPLVPFVVFVEDSNYSVELDFYGRNRGSGNCHFPKWFCDLFFFREYSISPSEIFATSFRSIGGSIV